MKSVNKIVSILQKKYGVGMVDVAIVVGSGQAEAVPNLENVVRVPYEKLGLPKSKVPGHSGSFVFGEYNGKKVVLVSRIHFYEHGKTEYVRVPFEIVSKLGASRVFLLTSTGGVNKSFKVGDVMIIKDHINFSGVNPMVGMENTRFVDMHNCYDKVVVEQIKGVAAKKKLDLREGVFCQMSGPCYETNAEIEMLRVVGGDVVSMSTAHDCIICNYLGMKVAGLAIVVNVYDDNNSNVSHEEVLANAKLACSKIKSILEEII